jgi:hypothetical protein
MISLRVLSTSVHRAYVKKAIPTPHYLSISASLVPRTGLQVPPLSSTGFCAVDPASTRALRTYTAACPSASPNPRCLLTPLLFPSIPLTQIRTSSLSLSSGHDSSLQTPFRLAVSCWIMRVLQEYRTSCMKRDAALRSWNARTRTRRNETCQGRCRNRAGDDECLMSASHVAELRYSVN